MMSDSESLSSWFIRTPFRFRLHSINKDHERVAWPLAPTIPRQPQWRYPTCTGNAAVVAAKKIHVPVCQPKHPPPMVRMETRDWGQRMVSTYRYDTRFYGRRAANVSLLGLISDEGQAK